MLHLWPLALTSCAESYVGIKRIEEFLLTPESEKDEDTQAHSCSRGIDNKIMTDDDEFVPQTIILQEKVSNEKESSCKRIQMNDNSKEKGVFFNGVTTCWSSDINEQNFGNYFKDCGEINHRYQ